MPGCLSAVPRRKIAGYRVLDKIGCQVIGSTSGQHGAEIAPETRSPKQRQASQGNQDGSASEHGRDQRSPTRSSEVDRGRDVTRSSRSTMGGRDTRDGYPELVAGATGLRMARGGLYSTLARLS